MLTFPCPWITDIFFWKKNSNLFLNLKHQRAEINSKILTLRGSQFSGLPGGSSQSENRQMGVNIQLMSHE